MGPAPFGAGSPRKRKGNNPPRRSRNPLHDEDAANRAAPSLSSLPRRCAPPEQRIHAEPLRRVCALPASETHCARREVGRTGQRTESLLSCGHTPWPHRGCDLMHME